MARAVFSVGDLEEQLKNDPECAKERAKAARKALGAAQAIAAGFTDTGDYAASLKVDGATLYTDDRAGHIIEWGSVDTEPKGTLRKAAEQIGARYVDEGP